MSPWPKGVPRGNKVEGEQPVESVGSAEVKEDSQPLIITSDIDAYILDRQRSQSKDLAEIDVKDVAPESEKHALVLPKPVEDLFKKRGYVGRWINKDKRMIDRALDIRGWAIANRTLFSELPKYLFSANGCIERGDAFLGFMPLRKAEKLRGVPQSRSNERVKNLPIDKWKTDGESYYKPKLSEESDGETLREGIQPDREPVEQVTGE